MTIADPYPSTVPGALEVHITRVLPDGSILEHEHAPKGWLTKDGTPRYRDWHAYWLTVADTKRRDRVRSITTVLNAIVPKDLTRWAEGQGIVGMAELVRRGLWHPDEHGDVVALNRVRGERLGMDATRDRAATRGVNVHRLAEEWMRDGRIPNPADHLPEHHGYIQAVARWLLENRPEPVVTEHIAYSATGRYAGRIDLLARIGGTLTLVDFKTQAAGDMYAQAHVQLRMQERALSESGDPVPERLIVVALAADGTFREAECAATKAAVDAAMAWYHELKPVDSVCAAANRAERAARKAAA